VELGSKGIQHCRLRHIRRSLIEALGIRLFPIAGRGSSCKRRGASFSFNNELASSLCRRFRAASIFLQGGKKLSGAMLLLFETPAGHALFKVLDEGKIDKVDVSFFLYMSWHCVVSEVVAMLTVVGSFVDHYHHVSGVPLCLQGFKIVKWVKRCGKRCPAISVRASLLLHCFEAITERCSIYKDGPCFGGFSTALDKHSCGEKLSRREAQLDVFSACL
jgi:hypothetical protein